MALIVVVARKIMQITGLGLTGLFLCAAPMALGVVASMLWLLSLYSPKVALFLGLAFVFLVTEWLRRTGYQNFGFGRKPGMPDLTIMCDAKQRVRFVCISDTHNDHSRLEVPDGDVLLHAGDFTKNGTEKEIKAFNEWMGTLPHKHKIVCAGNHDITLDKEYYEQHWKRHHDTKESADKARSLLSNCRYIEHEKVTVEGVTVFAAPAMPAKGAQWAWKRPEKELQEYWDTKFNLDDSPDILLTHAPPYDILDQNITGIKTGSRPLLSGLRRIKPKFCVFGHIHESYGVAVEPRSECVCINASSCTLLGSRPIFFFTS